MHSPAYLPNDRIDSIDLLSTVLGLAPQQLIGLSQSEQKYYRANSPKKKPDGTIRQTYRILSPLKEVQQNININIFHNVDFPFYLLGGIKDRRYPRDYVRSAALHAQSKIFLKEDIKNFFPSIGAFLVFDIWRSFFLFPIEICKLLTNLTTYKGFVPQGAPTSPYLANLVFWNKEPELEQNLSQGGFIYSRYFDDITISSKRTILAAEIHRITEKLYQMLFSLGFKPKRKKRRVMTARSKVQIHNLNVNSGKPTLSRVERMRIRAAVYECEVSASMDLEPQLYKKIYDSVRGRVANFQRLHPNQAEQYIERLELIKPGKINH